MAKVPPIAAGRHAKATGSKRMRQFGYRKVEVWFDQTEAAAVTFAAAAADKRLATYVRNAAVEAAAPKKKVGKK